VLTIQADGAMPQAVAAAVDKAADVFGGVDILVNNARIASMDSIDRFSLEEFDRTVAINVRAVFVATQAAIRYMKKGGGIVNIDSCNAERMPPVDLAANEIYDILRKRLFKLLRGKAEITVSGDYSAH
jgi:3-oxoacyl-[acyl-carrier protein] reductase